ncbi:arylesterase [uncultured Ferrovibrio sp.]|uniref:arylesterase n=1 Tax=uncultured Ferrovibrio sp. TaxID=1576913 RepID=UPI00260A88D3|nr:arylesterase [uncultured Ferrovibrio sp.]
MKTVHAEYGPFLRGRNAAWAVLVMLVTLLLAPLLLAPVLTAALASPASAAQKLLVLGDSLTAGYNLPPGDAYPAQLEAALKARGVNMPVINAGVSGDTTAAGLARLDWALAEKPTHVVVALGANDMLRGLPPEQARQNLDAIITQIKQAGVKVMLAGMLAAPNLGADYGKRFNSIYPDLAAKHGIPLYPFFLDGVVSDARLNLGDGLHPNRDGVAVMVERTLPQILRFLEN